jgi:glutathione S-transferase
MLILYHTDMAVWAGKVSITLAEKDLEWSGRHIDLSIGEEFATAKFDQAMALHT